MTKFEETIHEMENQVEELEKDVKDAAEKLDDEQKQKAEALAEKTKAAINASIDKVTSIIEQVKDDEKLDEFLDKVKAKSKEAVEFTKTKIAELSKKEENKIDLDKIGDEIVANFDKLKETDAYKKSVDFIKELGDNINNFFEKPEVKETIDKAKTGVIDAAEKGVEGLKKFLAPEEKKEEEAPVEEEPKE